MPDLGTMKQDLLIDLGEVSGNLDRIGHKIAQAIEHHKGRNYHFLTDRFQLALKDSRASYDLIETTPQISSIKGDRCWLLVNGNRDDRSRVHRRPYRHIEDLLTGTSVAANFPTEYSVHGSEILVYPPPSGGKHILAGWARLAASSPRPEWNLALATPAWEFPDDTFTNVWFTHGYQLVREYAAWLLLSGPKDDKERANAAVERYRMIERDILLEGEERQLATRAEPSS